MKFPSPSRSTAYAVIALSASVTKSDTSTPLPSPEVSTCRIAVSPATTLIVPVVSRLLPTKARIRPLPESVGAYTSALDEVSLNTNPGEPDPIVSHHAVASPI